MRPLCVSCQMSVRSDHMSDVVVLIHWALMLLKMCLFHGCTVTHCCGTTDLRTLLFIRTPCRKECRESWEASGGPEENGTSSSPSNLQAIFATWDLLCGQQGFDYDMLWERGTTERERKRESFSCLELLSFFYLKVYNFNQTWKNLWPLFIQINSCSFLFSPLPLGL